MTDTIINIKGFKILARATGDLYRLPYIDKRGTPRPFSKIPKTVTPQGYACCSIGGTRYQYHRVLAQAFFTQFDGTQHVDHINGIKLDNRVSNLRLVTQTENNRAFKAVNSKATSKYRGVSWMPSRNKWRATIMVDYKQHHLGLFDSESEAALAYGDAASKFNFKP